MNILTEKVVISSLLKLQLFYCALGVGYNVVSYVKAATGGQPLSSTSPIIGAVFMLIYGADGLFSRHGWLQWHHQTFHCLQPATGCLFIPAGLGSSDWH